jgi:putative membrane protein
MKSDSNNNRPDEEYLATFKAATDFLAKDRTVLANERTLLAYVRTALMMLATGITFIKLNLFHEDPFTQKLGWVLSCLSVPVFIFSIHRFRTVAKHLNSRYKH